MRLGNLICFTCMLILAGCKPAPGGTPGDPDTPQKNSQPLTSAAGVDSTQSTWQIESGRVGPVARSSSESDLRRHYGPEAVDTARIQLGEGETTPGIILYPRDSLRRAEIIWRDTVNRREPARVVLRGSRSQWQVNGRISLGTSLKDLERLNGKPFTLAGFGWDYAGVITDWQGGALDSALAGIKLYLDPGPAQQHSAAYSQVLGDRDYSSTLPAMQQLNPRVGQIFVDFE